MDIRIKQINSNQEQIDQAQINQPLLDIIYEPKSFSDLPRFPIQVQDDFSMLNPTLNAIQEIRQQVRALRGQIHTISENQIRLQQQVQELQKNQILMIGINKESRELNQMAQQTDKKKLLNRRIKQEKKSESNKSNKQKKESNQGQQIEKSEQKEQISIIEQRQPKIRKLKYKRNKKKMRARTYQLVKQKIITLEEGARRLKISKTKIIQEIQDCHLE